VPQIVRKQNKAMSAKVAQVCLRYYPHIGGVETHIKAISERLVNQGIEIDILTTDAAGKLPRVEIMNNLTIKRFKGWVPNNAYYFSPELEHYLRKNSGNYNIVHAHNYSAFPALHAVLAKKRNKLIFTPHYNGTSPERIRRLLHIPYGLLWARLLRRVDKIICVSQAAKLLFQANFSVPDEKIVIISNGVEVDAIQAAQSYDVNDKVILYMGRMEKYKNVHHIIEAMPYLSEQYVLYIVGDGPYKGALVQLMEKLNLRDRVKILSGLSNTEVYRWYKTCSVFVTLSSLEAFGITVLEGVAAGKPVVASDIPAFRELANRVHGIQLANISCIAPQELAEIIASSAESNPPKSDLSDFSWDSIAARISSIYEELLLQEGKR